MVSFKNFKRRAALFILTATMACFMPAASWASELHFFTTVDKTTAGKYFNEALALLAKGETAEALLKFEPAIVSDGSLLAQPDLGMKKMLIQKYEDIAAKSSTGEVSTYYKLGHLYDLSGNIENSIRCYHIALRSAISQDIKKEVEERVKTLSYEVKIYQSEMARQNEIERNERDAETAKQAAIAVKEEKEAVQKQKEQDALQRSRDDKIKELRLSLSALDKKIEALTPELEKASSSERMAKNDWSGRTEFQREWRNTPNEEASDPSDPYQSTYRRRYRQAKKSRENIESELSSLKMEKEDLEKEIEKLSQPPEVNE